MNGINLIARKSQKRKSNNLLIFLTILCTICFLCLSGYRVYKKIVFSIECKGHIKRAADANIIPLALQEMETVIQYLESNQITEGYTSVIYKTPDEDIGFWYQNLKASTDELKKVSEDSTPLEKSNILMKLRETLLDQGQTTKVTLPTGIEIFPNNKEFCYLYLLSLLIIITILGIHWYNNNNKLTLIDLVISVSIAAIALTILISQSL